MNKSNNLINLPPSLVDIISSGDAVLVIGNQLSVEAGLPSTDEMMEVLAERIGLPVDKRVDFPTVARYYENQCKRQELISLIRKYNDTVGKKISLNHQKLARLGIRTWITTNYDDLLEQTLRQNDECRGFIVVTQDKNLSYVSSSQATLVKLLGSCEQPETLIVTHRDYETYSRKFPRVEEKLNSLLVDKTFLFVGYPPDDRNLHLILNKLAFDLQPHQRSAYIILHKVDEFTREDLRLQNVFVIDASVSGASNSAQHLEIILDALIEKVEQMLCSVAVQPQSTGGISPERVEDVTTLLDAMGYRILDRKVAQEHIYFLCSIKWMAEIRHELIHFVEGHPGPSVIAGLNESAITSDAHRGILLTAEPLDADLQNLIRIRERLRCYTLDEFTNLLADFQHYLEKIVQEYEAGEISRYYISLGGERDAEQGKSAEEFESMEEYIDRWLKEEGRNHLSTLGNFGSGKTWLCRRYAYLAAKRYLSTPQHNRIPILINLRNYSKSYDVEQMITDALVNQYGVHLAKGYRTFDRLNVAGRLLIMFDGFDEMAQQVSDYRVAVDNFWELSTVVHPNSKVILTCRLEFFRHRAEESDTLVPSSPSSTNLVTDDQVIDMRDRHEFEVVYLQEFSEDHIRLLLQRRLPAIWEDAYRTIKSVKGLQDLASRPIMLDMIVSTLPHIHQIDVINQANLYEIYINNLLKRRWSETTGFIPPEDRLFLMQELAQDMYVTQKLAIHFSEFPEI